MTDSKLLSALAEYETFLVQQGIKAAPMSHNYRLDLSKFQDRDQLLSHCLYSIPQIRLFIAEGRRDKAFRWYGYIQGSLAAAGIYTIEELKNHSRPD